MGVDRTFIAVKNQLKAMSCCEYEIGIGKPNGKMWLRTWNQERILKSLNWLKKENMEGSHIYIRPLGSSGLILVDDLTISTIDKMEADNISPALYLETSPQNYQAWVRVSETSIDNEIATGVAKVLSQKYGGDPNSADWRHFGRLAGFTNRKNKYIDTLGNFPFVLLHGYKGTAINNRESEELLHKGGELMRLAAELPPVKVSNKKRVGGISPTDYFNRAMANFKSKYGNQPEGIDYSIADWKIATGMAKSGYSGDVIRQAILENSHGINERKKGHIINYANRTVDKVFGFDFKKAEILVRETRGEGNLLAVLLPENCGQLAREYIEMRLNEIVEISLNRFKKV